VWGTDWPHTQFEDVQNARLTREMLESVAQQPEQLHAVLVDTPAALFQFR